MHSCGGVIVLLLAHLAIPYCGNNSVSDAGDEGFTELPSMSKFKT